MTPEAYKLHSLRAISNVIQALDNLLIQCDQLEFNTDLHFIDVIKEKRAEMQKHMIAYLHLPIEGGCLCQKN